MIRGRFINRGMVHRFVDGFWSRSIRGMPFVNNFSNIAGIVISGVIGYDLGSTIGKKYSVLSRG